jgi:hypothetical protein
MPVIRIHRVNEYTNKLRSYQLYIDGKKAGQIRNGEIKEFEVMPGSHKVIARIDWASSKEIKIEVGEDEVKELQVRGFRNGNWLIPISFLIIALHFILRFTVGFDYLIFLIIPGFTILVYYNTIGRKEYLRLREKEG